MKKFILILSLSTIVYLPLAIGGGCFWQFTQVANEAAGQFDRCITRKCVGFFVADRDRCKIACDAQYEGALNSAVNKLEWCLAAVRSRG